MKKLKKKRSAWAIFFRPIKFVFCLLLLFMVLGGLGAGVVLLRYEGDIKECRQKAMDIVEMSKREDFTQPSDTRIYGADGRLIGLINSGHYEYVEIEGISQNLQDAYVAQEDRRFYEHHGVDYMGLMRAGLALVKNRGEITQGGSTITQQVIKNTYLTQEKSFLRKVTELFAAPLMEKKYSKEDILEFYCNTNFYANRCYGVAEASLYYFNKDAKDLEVWEAATLAGISNNPSRYDPVAHPEASKEKRNQIIDNMALCGYITAEEQEKAKAQPIKVEKVYEPGAVENYMTSYAIYCAAQELMRNDGFEFQYTFKDKASNTAYKEAYQELFQEKSDMIRNGGFEIHTTLDQDIQDQLQQVIDTSLEKFTDVQDNGKFALQGAAVCIDNKSGYVVAICGGRGTEDAYNRGFLSRRQPGSTIKPLIDYGPAFETGFYYPSRIMDDHQFEDGPKNSGNKYYGTVSVREALNRSLNTVAWQVLADIGVDTGMSYLDKMHFSGLSWMDNGNFSMSIGGFSEGARVVDMARGYSVLANEGKFSNKTCITSIQSQYEGELFQKEEPDEQVYTEDTAYIVTDVLKGTFTKAYGTGYGLGLKVPCAGKTGTTNNNKDAWFCGYTKYYTTAIWMGYDTPKPMTGIFGRTYSGQMWHDFMAGLHEGLEEEDWEMPETVSYCYVNRKGDKVDYDSGKKDLFSSVAEERAKADLERWEEEQKKKVSETKAYKSTKSSSGNASQADQIAGHLSSLIGQLNGMSTRDGAQGVIDQAYGLLNALSGTSYYSSLKQQLDSAASRASGLPSGETEGPKEIGPGVNLKPTDAPVVRPNEPELSGPGMTAAPETAPPETAPETVAPQTEAPQTAAPETAPPQTEAPQTAAPPAEAPVPENPEG